MALAAETLTVPSPSPSSCPMQVDQRTGALREHPLFNRDFLRRLYTTPLLAVDFAFYSATPVYYLLHYSPFRDELHLDGSGNSVLKWLVTLVLFLIAQYFTSVMVVSWGRRYQVRENMAVSVLVAAGVLSCLKFWTDDMGITTAWTGLSGRSRTVT